MKQPVLCFVSAGFGALAAIAITGGQKTGSEAHDLVGPLTASAQAAEPSRDPNLDVHETPAQDEASDGASPDLDQAGNVVAQLPPQRSPRTSPRPAAPRFPPQQPLRPLAPVAVAGDEFTPEERVNIAVYERVNRSVVHINTRAVPNERFVFAEVPSRGSGSGVVIDNQGHIVTNNHVIEHSNEIDVTLYNGRSYPAKVVGHDVPNDLAVIRINAKAEDLYPVDAGDSTRLRVGQHVYAIGNPFGLERTLTTGVVASLNRSIPLRGGRSIKSIIQIDADINPGNSGGPLLDSRGRLIGINTAIASNTGQSSGVGFAIPINSVRRIVPQLIENGRVIRPTVGISRVYQTDHGLLIAQLKPNGPAAQAGLRGPRVIRRQSGRFVFQSVDISAADLIVAVDGKPVKTADDFLTIVEEKRPGDEIVVSVLRDDREMDVKLRLDSDE